MITPALWIFKNCGQRLVSTNYWDSEHARRGYFFLTWNAGAARLLVPDSQKPLLREMKGAREVILSRGPWTEQNGREALELLWEDGSDNPFVIHLVTEQCDRLAPSEDQGSGLTVIALTRGGEKGRWAARYRVVTALPSLEPWQAH